MDGRVQLPVISYLKNRFNAGFVDVIREPGPNMMLAERNDPYAVDSIIERITISVEKHGSVGIAIVGHYDCAGNPSSRDEQAVQLEKARVALHDQFPDVEIIKLWVDKTWTVNEVA